MLVGVTLIVAGCSFADKSLFPSLTGSDPRGTDPSQSQVTTTAQAGATGRAVATPVSTQPTSDVTNQPALGSTNFEPSGVTDGKDTGTFVGQKVTELRNELKRLQGDVSKNNGDLQSTRAKTVGDSQKYHATIAAISSRLQVGTTPGNPILVDQFNQSLTQLDQIGDDITRMNMLSTQVTGDSTLANFLTENTRAALRLSGAVDEDHRQLAILQDEVSRTVVLIDRLLRELTDDIQRQTNYVSSERANLNTLSAAIKNGELFGDNLSNRAVASALAMSPPPIAQSSGAAVAGRRPLVVIRFDRPDVSYDQALYNAVSRTLEKRPQATFELVAVAPSSGGAARVAVNSNQARRNAETVARSLQQMGLPPQRVAISSQTSDTAQSNEVHLYLN